MNYSSVCIKCHQLISKVCLSGRRPTLCAFFHSGVNRHCRLLPGTVSRLLLCCWNLFYLFFLIYVLAGVACSHGVIVERLLSSSSVLSDTNMPESCPIPPFFSLISLLSFFLMWLVFTTATRILNPLPQQTGTLVSPSFYFPILLSPPLHDAAMWPAGGFAGWEQAALLCQRTFLS